MKALATALLLVTGCATAGLEGAHSGGGGALLGEYVASARELNNPGIIAKDLSGAPADAMNDNDRSVAEITNQPPGGAFAKLAFGGATADSFCVLHRHATTQDDEAPADKFVKEDRDALALSPLWVLAVDSLDQVSKLPPWPAPPGGVPLTTVKLLGDDKVTIVKKKPQDGGGYVEVKNDVRIIRVGICGARPAVTASSRFLIAINHADANAPGIDPHQFDTEQNRRSRMSRDGMFVWALTDDGEYDLSK